MDFYFATVKREKAQSIQYEKPEVETDKPLLDRTTLNELNERINNGKTQYYHGNIQSCHKTYLRLYQIIASYQIACFIVVAFSSL